MDILAGLENRTVKGSVRLTSKDISEVQLCQSLSATSVAFDDPNLVSSAGLVPVLALASRCGLHTAGALLTVPNPNAAIKTAAVVAGMVAEADSIDDLDRPRLGPR
jgi:hypothetical protein